MVRSVIAAIAAAMLISACTTTQSLVPILVSIDRPGADEIAVAELGGAVLETSRSVRYDGILLENRVTWLDLFKLRQFAIEPGRLVAREADQDFTYYFSDQLSFWDPLTGLTSRASGGICISKTDPKQVRAFTTSGSCGIQLDQWPRFSATSVVDGNATNFRDELIYGGRSGSLLRFVYWEFSAGQPSPTLSMEFQIDLSEGPVFGFRGARIEVLEAANASLKYRVISPFPERER
ncbi:MAG: hypothetical protein Q8L23_17090 [Caulobacter sp.]|nr:hypothetical protein [Caulobacter sp.]